MNEEDMEEAPWPDWLEEKRIPDAQFDSAYDAANIKVRGALKTGLALAHFHFGAASGKQLCATEGRHAGFWQKTALAPCSWAMIIAGRNVSPARLTAACILPILADTPHICLISADYAAPSLLLALDLCGVPDAYNLAPSQIPRLLEETRNSGKGRLVLLHDNELGDAGKIARGLGIPVYEENRAPLIGVDNPDAFDLDTLKTCQGDFALHWKTRHPDAIFTARPESFYAQAQSGDAPLVLTPGCEGFWLYPLLDKKFFQISVFSLGLLDSRAD